jgi:transposase
MTQKIDTRKLSSAELLVLRRQAIRLRAQSSSFQDIAAITGVSSKTVSAWCRAYEKEGEASFTYKKRGRIEGDQRSLTEAQEDRVQREITDKMPGQCKLAFALWTRRAVQQLIVGEGHAYSYGWRLLTTLGVHTAEALKKSL